jgi:hypothetical protein
MTTKMTLQEIAAKARGADAVVESVAVRHQEGSDLRTLAVALHVLARCVADLAEDG